MVSVMARPRREPPAWAIANSELGAFLRANRETVEDWDVIDRHVPLGRGCQACGEPWPCTEIRVLASGWCDRTGWRDDWGPIG